jgi:WD40 repeat protein
MAYSPDGTLLAVGSTGALSSPLSTATIFDAATGEVRRTLPGLAAWLWGLAFSPDGKRLAAVYFAAGGKIWDVSTGEELMSLQSFDSGLAVAYSPDGTLLATCGGGGKLQLWDARSGLPLFSLASHAGFVFAVSMSADARLLATASNDGTTRVYTLRAEDLLTLARQRLTRGLTTEECQKYLHRETCR